MLPLDTDSMFNPASSLGAWVFNGYSKWLTQHLFLKMDLYKVTNYHSPLFVTLFENLFLFPSAIFGL